MLKKKTDSIYLDKLQYNSALGKSWFAFWVDKIRVVILLIIMILIGGYFAYNQLPLEGNPEVKLGMAYVMVSLPGASAESVEDLITKKIEKNIAKLTSIDKLNSSSSNGMAIITVTLKAGEDIESNIRKIKDKVDETKKDLPTDAKDPIVEEISFNSQPVWTFSIGGNYDGFTLRKYAEKIKTELEQIGNVSKVNIDGGDEIEYVVYYNSQKLEEYGISYEAANQALSTLNMNMPIGEIKIANYKHTITLDNRFYTIGDIENIVVGKNSNIGLIYMKNIAKVVPEPKKKVSLSRVSINGADPIEAIGISVVKKPGGSIISLVEEGQKKVNEMLGKTIPADIKVKTVYSMAETIKEQMDSLKKDFIITIGLVMLVLFLFLGGRLAIVPTLTIPLVFCATFVGMNIFGLTFNFLSLFSLVLSLGLLVDDAVLIVTAFDQYYKVGKYTKREAMLLVLKDYSIVDASTTFVIIWIFAAMLFMSGIMGKFMQSLPFVIVMTLLASLVFSITLVPALTIYFQGKGEHEGTKKGVWYKIKNFFYGSTPLLSFDYLRGFYEKSLIYIFKKKSRERWVLFWIFILFVGAVSLPITGILKTEFFPKSDQNLFFINIEGEIGQKLEVTSENARKVEEILKGEKDIESYITTIGSLSEINSSDFASNSANTNNANISINLIKKADGRKETSMSITERLRKKVNEKIKIPGTKVTVEEMSDGPPVGRDLEIKIQGDDLKELNRILEEMKKVATTIPGALNISTSQTPVPIEFKVSFNSSKLALYGLSLPQVASFLRMSVDGLETTKIYQGTDELIIRTKLNQAQTDTLSKIKDLKIKNNAGQYVFLRQILNDDMEASTNAIVRTNQKRVVALYAAADKTTNGTIMMQQFTEKTKDYKLPAGYSFISGGANDENAKSVQSLLVAMTFGMLLIIFTMVLQFNSYKEALLSIVPIPLSLIGVFIGLTLFGQTLSFPALIGLVSLFGMVSNHSIYLIDKINLNLKFGIPLDESIIDAGTSRFEPVFLTSLTTILGNIPVAITEGFWQSIAQTMVFGLSTAAILKFYVVPILYKMFIKKKILSTSN